MCSLSLESDLPLHEGILNISNFIEGTPRDIKIPKETALVFCAFWNFDQDKNINFMHPLLPFI
jgi:hypothetical protein